ncbi:hypothetical protein EDB86DRAFT_3047487 [Lactarius hatsudake]|nr:hypothetical protein EDB86DRAFT_3047487 [Lactarius hatsudake]
MSSLEDFYQELDARMALSHNNEDWRRFSSRERQASHRTSGSTSLSHDDDSVSLPVATISPPPSTNEIGFMTSKRKASPQGFLESEQGADPLSSKKGGEHKTSSLPAPSAPASSEKRKKVTISSVVLAAPAPIQDMPPATEDPTNALGSSTAAKRDSSSSKETSAVTPAPGNTARTGTGAHADASIGKRPKASAITLMAKHSAAGGKGKGKKTKDKPELVTPAEFARRLRQAAVAGPSETETETGSHNNKARREAPSQYLKDYVIFYAGGDLTYASARTRGCMSYIHRHGGTVLPVFDPVTATHVVTETSQKMTLRALGLKSLSDIPLEIPTVKWSWVNSGKPIPGEKDKRQMDYEFMHAAFPSRMDAGRSFADSSRSRGKQKAGDDANQPVVTGSRQGPDEPAGRAESSSSRASSRGIGEEEPSVLPQDLPQERRRGRDVASNLSEGKQVAVRRRRKSHSPSNEGKARKKLKGFICDDPTATAAANASSCVNQDIVDKLNELAELHRAKPTQDDKWRVFSYTKAIAALRKCKERIGSLEQARSLNGVGDKTAQKIMEIIETGALRRVDAERTEDVAVVQLFQGIYGVGQSIAYAWYFAGCRTLDDIRERKGGIKLTSIQELGLKYYDDINTRMSREEARVIFEEIRSIGGSSRWPSAMIYVTCFPALCLDPKLFVEIMGSYRRGKSTCGDIDIMVTRPPDDGKTHAGILPKLLSALRSAGIITEDLLSLPPDATDSLEVTYRGLCVRPTKPGQGSPSRSQIRRRIGGRATPMISHCNRFDPQSICFGADILAIPWESRGAALIYFTGDDIFNRSLRLKANKMGYSLNQRGLFEGVVRSLEDRAIKTNAGNVIASETEEEIFRILVGLGRLLLGNRRRLLVLSVYWLCMWLTYLPSLGSIL